MTDHLSPAVTGSTFPDTIALHRTESSGGIIHQTMNGYE